MARFNVSETGASAELYAEALRDIVNSVDVSVSVDWFGVLMVNNV